MHFPENLGFFTTFKPRTAGPDNFLKSYNCTERYNLGITLSCHWFKWALMYICVCGVLLWAFYCHRFIWALMYVCVCCGPLQAPYSHNITQIYVYLFIQGKGSVKTYWLTGKNDFNKPLPEPPPLNRYVIQSLHSEIICGDFVQKLYCFAL